MSEDSSSPFSEHLIRQSPDYKLVEKEFERLGFDKTQWRISTINHDFKFCNSYPRFFILPATFNDDELGHVAKFRTFRRVPVAVWRFAKNGCFIMRCSQPAIGVFWYRSPQDENLIQAYVDIIPNEQQQQPEEKQQQEQKDEQEQTNSEETTNTSSILIVDARSYPAAWANRAKGGGLECEEYYQACKIQYMNLANIHGIRKSFQSLQTACEAYSEQSNNWNIFLENSRWLHHISGLLFSALLVVDTISIDQKSALIHCSDGWDRTPQIVALAELMLDPYYRTFEGFRMLIKREWLDFGHKFADRCGNQPCSDDLNERCPVFLQWLDCVQQLMNQYPKEFEFDTSYLDKLNRHTFANIFGTFSKNNSHERFLVEDDEKTFSIWEYFQSCKSKFRNLQYVKNSTLILRPSCQVPDLIFWKELYLSLLKYQNYKFDSINTQD